MEGFLKKYESDEGSSHTMMLGKTFIKPGKWKIPNEKLDELYGIYAKEYKKGYTLVERHIENVSPIVIDIDIKQNENIRKITDDFIEEIVGKLYGEINKYIDLKEHNGKCYVMQRELVYENERGTYKDGLHIQFPYLVTEFEYQIKMRTNLLDSFMVDNRCNII